MDRIEISNGNATSFVGRDAVEVFRLAALISALSLEIKCPGMQMSSRMSALKAAKGITGLKTNKRELHLARAKIMLEQAKTEVVYVDKDEVQS